MSVVDGRRAIQGPHRAHGTVVSALLVAVVVGAAMLVTGRLLDPWTAGLVAPLTVALALVTRTKRPPAQASRAGLHDEIDEETGVGNARAVLATLDRELERARSYDTVFSLAIVEIDHLVFAAVHPRRTHRVLADLLGGVARDVRLGDRVCRVRASDRELVVVVLPDTAGQGARTFADRLLGLVQRRLAAEGLGVDDHLRTELMTHPDDLDLIRRLRRRLEVLDGTDALIRDVAVRRRRGRRPTQGLRAALPEDTEVAAPGGE